MKLSGQSTGGYNFHSPSIIPSFVAKLPSSELARFSLAVVASHSLAGFVPKDKYLPTDSCNFLVIPVKQFSIIRIIRYKSNSKLVKDNGFQLQFILPSVSVHRPVRRWPEEDTLGIAFIITDVSQLIGIKLQEDWSLRVTGNDNNYKFQFLFKWVETTFISSPTTDERYVILLRARKSVYSVGPTNRKQ